MFSPIWHVIPQSDITISKAVHKQLSSTSKEHAGSRRGLPQTNQLLTYGRGCSLAFTQLRPIYTRDALPCR